MIRRTLAAKALLVVGGVGVVASLLGIVVGLRAIAALDRAVVDSSALTAQALASLDASVTLAEDMLTTFEETLSGTEATTRELVAAFDDGEELLVAAAELSEEEIAPTIAAAQAALPGLVEAAAIIDGALTAVSALPFGPSYAPEEPFDESLRRLERELDGLPEHVIEQAELIRQAGDSLGTVRDGTGDVADDLAALHDRLGTAAELLEGYADTAGEASQLVAESESALNRHLQAARVMTVVLGLTLAAVHALPAAAGWLLLHPERLRALLVPD